MEETTRKSIITAAEIVLLIIVLYIISQVLQGYLDGLEEAEMIATAIRFALI